MKLITFTYTKADNSTSERTLLTTVIPGDKFAGIDLSSMDPEDVNFFVTQYKTLHEEFVAQVKSLQVQFDIKHNYRQFNASGMTEITEI